MYRSGSGYLGPTVSSEILDIVALAMIYKYTLFDSLLSIFMLSIHFFTILEYSLSLLQLL